MRSLFPSVIPARTHKGYFYHHRDLFLLPSRQPYPTATTSGIMQRRLANLDNTTQWFDFHAPWTVLRARYHQWEHVERVYDRTRDSDVCRRT